jgi:hypothetical protein
METGLLEYADRSDPPSLKLRRDEMFSGITRPLSCLMFEV